MVSFPPVSPPRPYTPHSPHRSSLILPNHLRLGLPSGLFPSGFPTKTLYTPLSPQIHHNIIHPSTPRSPQLSLSLRFPHQDPTQPSSHPSCHILIEHYRKMFLFTIRVSSTTVNLPTIGSTHPPAVSPPKTSHNMYVYRTVCTA